MNWSIVQKLRIACICAALLLCAHIRVLAQEYGFDVWTTANGLPQNTVTGLAQTPDGYLWLSTFDGLARFDGVRFTIFDKANTNGIVNNRFERLFVDRAGTLFASTDNKIITVYRDGIFTSYSELADPEKAVSIIVLKGDQDGNAVIETDDTDYYLQDGQFVPIPGQKQKGRKFTYFGKSGTRWVFEPEQISQIKDDRSTVYKIKLDLPALRAPLALRPFEDSKGSLWITENRSHQMVRLADGVVSFFTPKEIPNWSGNLLTSAKEEADGSIGFFFGMGYPLKPAQYVRLKENKFTTYQFNEVIDSGVGLTDREGNVWLGTTTGLRRLRRQLITNLSVKDGLNSNEVYPILETESGEALIGSSKGLNRIAGGKVFDLAMNYSPGFPIVSSGLLSDSNNGLLVGYSRGFGRFANGSLNELRQTIGSVTDLTPDREGYLWVSSGEGLFKFRDDNEIAHFTGDDGLPNINVVLTHQDRNGDIWAGTFDGVAVLKGDRFAVFTDQPNSPRGYVREIYEDRDGVLWFGTYGDGLYRYKDGRFFNYRVDDGLFSNGIFAILEDNGNFWMSSNRGIHRVSVQELNDYADGRIPKLNSVSYDEQDGMINAECNGGRLPAAIKTRDGKLWFATMGGVAIVDPTAEMVNPLPPNVVIENVSVDRKLVAVNNSQIELMPGQSNVAIEYTGLSLINSEQIKFRYKLDGLDKDWVEAGTKRTVDYSYLPPGNYTFRLTAANANGVWNSDGTAISIVVQPYFYKTWWFIGLLALVVGALIWWMYFIRVSRLRAIADAKTLFSRQLIESQESERKRIASELHDGLGQNLVIIKNRASLGLAKGDDSERVARELTSISESASQALDEVREITNNLRPQLLDRLGITRAINAMLKKVAGVVDIESSIDDIDRIFSEADEIGIYRIIQESLNNVVKHSNASNVVVNISRTGNAVLITIKDNGRGFDVGAAISGRAGLGLIGLGERAKLIGGEFSISSVIGQGTRVALRINK